MKIERNIVYNEIENHKDSVVIGVKIDTYEDGVICSSEHSLYITTNIENEQKSHDEKLKQEYMKEPDLMAVLTAQQEQIIELQSIIQKLDKRINCNDIEIRSIRDDNKKLNEKWQNLKHTNSRLCNLENSQRTILHRLSECVSQSQNADALSVKTETKVNELAKKHDGLIDVMHKELKKIESAFNEVENDITARAYQVDLDLNNEELKKILNKQIEYDREIQIKRAFNIPTNYSLGRKHCTRSKKCKFQEE